MTKHLTSDELSRLTPEQFDIAEKIDQGESMFVNALAGTGKTSTLRASLTGSWAMLAFNKKNADELRKADPSKGVFGRAIEGDVMTLNGLGHRAWARYLKARPEPRADKYYEIARDKAASLGLKRGDIWAASKIAEHAIVAGIPLDGTPVGDQYPGLPNEPDSWRKVVDSVLDEEPSEEALYAAPEIAKIGLLAAFGSSPVITFDEQLVLPLRYGARFGDFNGNKYPRIAVDEAQDLSPMNHAMIQRALQKGGQLVAVGDPNQAIYGFRGADLNSVETMKSRFQLNELPLTMNWRCDLAIIEHAQELVPTLRPRPNARPGVVNMQAEFKPLDGDWVLGRTNASVVSAAFKLIKEHRTVTILGSDILKSLKGRTLFIARKQDHLDLKTFQQLLADWFEVAQLNEFAYPAQFQRAKEFRDVLNVFLRELSPTKTVKDLLDTMQFLFARKGRIICSTIHRSKGGEGRGVWIVEAANSADWMKRNEQEDNLDYVSRTRAEKELNYTLID